MRERFLVPLATAMALDAAPGCGPNDEDVTFTTTVVVKHIGEPAAYYDGFDTVGQPVGYTEDGEMTFAGPIDLELEGHVGCGEISSTEDLVEVNGEYVCANAFGTPVEEATIQKALVGPGESVTMSIETDAIAPSLEIKDNTLQWFDPSDGKVHNALEEYAARRGEDTSCVFDRINYLGSPFRQDGDIMPAEPGTEAVVTLEVDDSTSDSIEEDLDNLMIKKIDVDLEVNSQIPEGDARVTFECRVYSQRTNWDEPYPQYTVTVKADPQ